MTAAQELVDALADAGYGDCTGVPCSLLKGAFALLEDGGELRYVPAVREDAAVGLAVGLQLGGRRCAVLMQSSGLGYCLNPLLSLSELYELALPLIVGWRGAHPGDAPEHVALGARLPAILTAAGMPHVRLDVGAIRRSVAEVVGSAVRARGPAALLVSDAL